jgi:hypothetical protein
VDISVQHQACRVLNMLERAQKVFGAGQPTEPVPSFVDRRDLETDLGRGRFRLS